MGSRAGRTNRGEEVVWKRSCCENAEKSWEGSERKAARGDMRVYTEFNNLFILHQNLNFPACSSLQREKLSCLRVQRDWANDESGCVELRCFSAWRSCSKFCSQPEPSRRDFSNVSGHRLMICRQAIDWGKLRVLVGVVTFLLGERVG